MRYKRFIISNYRAIVGPLEIKIKNASLTPIIGVNESGKTTILHALFSFDYYNDTLNDNGRHLEDVANLYQTSPPPAEVAAEIEFTKRELKHAIDECSKQSKQFKVTFSELSRKRNLPDAITITRNLVSRKYSVATTAGADGFEFFPKGEIQNEIAQELITSLPYTLYFDDFRDKIPERIEIPSSPTDSSSGWLGIVQQLFIQTDKNFSVFKLATLEERQRKSVLSKVERKLNETLTKEWQTFRLDDREALKISIDFDQQMSSIQGTAPQQVPPARADGTVNAAEPKSTTVVTNYLKFDVVEKDIAGDSHFFFISDRSKGFYWFFNFVMKLEFNPKLVSGEEAHAIYLLDEPGSYLHAFAQRKLCQKLRQISEANWVGYCTHSHYLLDPEVIPVNSIMVADKSGRGVISLVSLTSYNSPVSEKRSALQPVLDALQIKPFALDLINTRLTVITEGIYDYFALELFRGGRNISILPSVGADSIKFYVSLLIAWQIDFRAIWDNDPEGITKSQQASQLFGSEIASRSFRLLPLTQKGGRRILQNLFDGQDLVKFRAQLGLPNDCSFERTLQAVFYSERKDDLVAGVSQSTKDNFREVFESLSLRL